MPAYEYKCDANGRKVTAYHPMDVELHTWGELCYVTQEKLGETDPYASVRRLPGTPYVHVPTGNTELREQGFAKLVRRDVGVYENVTRIEGEARYLESGKPQSVPNLAKRISD